MEDVDEKEDLPEGWNEPRELLTYICLGASKLSLLPFLCLYM